MRRVYGALLVVAFLLSPVGCVKAPPNLSPQASVAFSNARVQKALDLIRDTVDDGSKTVPPVFSVSLDKQVATWHESAIMIVHERAAGWKAAVLKSLDELQKNLLVVDKKNLAVYITLAKTVLNEVAP